MPDLLTVAHVTDTHFGGSPQAGARARAVVDYLVAMDPPPDLLLVSGDVADHGRPDEYAEAHAVLSAWSGPIGIAVGNHDVRETFVAGLGDRLHGGATNQAFVVGDRRFVLLDSLVDAVDGKRQDHGVLTGETLSWLEAQLGDGRPTYLCLHHPPVDLGIELMDPIRLRDPDRLEAIVRAHPEVAAVLVGHAHTAASTTFADRPLLLGGGVVSTVLMDQDPYPRLWYDAPPTFALHLLREDGRIVTQWRALPTPDAGVSTVD